MRATDALRLDQKYERVALSALPRMRQEASAAYPVPELGDDFAEWFQGSAMVNADGSPRVLYHGTRVRFDKFSEGRPVAHSGGRKRNGEWWSGSPSATDGVVPNLGRGARSRLRVVGVYVTPDPVLASGYGPHVLVVFLRVCNPRRVSTRDEAGTLTPARRAELEAQGFDGIVFGYSHMAEYVAFHPDQARIVACHPSIYWEEK